MRKYYISFMVIPRSDVNNVNVDTSTKYGDIFIDADKYLDENYIKNIKDGIKKQYKLDTKSQIIFMNITDLTEKIFDAEPFRGDKVLSEKITTSTEKQIPKEMEEAIRKGIVETSNGQTADPVELYRYG